MPAPEENAGQLYEHLLRRNLKLAGMAFAIGDEDAVFLQGPAARRHGRPTTSSTGSSARSYAYVEQCFRPAMRIGFASRFKADCHVHFRSFSIALDPCPCVR